MMFTKNITVLKDTFFQSNVIMKINENNEDNDISMYSMKIIIRKVFQSICGRAMCH